MYGIWSCLGARLHCQLGIALYFQDMISVLKYEPSFDDQKLRPFTAGNL